MFRDLGGQGGVALAERHQARATSRPGGVVVQRPARRDHRRGNTAGYDDTAVTGVADGYRVTGGDSIFTCDIVVRHGFIPACVAAAEGSRLLRWTHLGLAEPRRTR